jgi:hypothetical protein
MQTYSKAFLTAETSVRTTCRCPEGRTERLRTVNEREGLVECEWDAAVGCPHAVYFEGRFYCSALVKREAA